MARVEELVELLKQLPPGGELEFRKAGFLVIKYPETEFAIDLVYDLMVTETEYAEFEGGG